MFGISPLLFISQYSWMELWMYSLGTQHSIQSSAETTRVSLQLFNSCPSFCLFLSPEYFCNHVSLLLVSAPVECWTRSFLGQLTAQWWQNIEPEVFLANAHDDHGISNLKFPFPASKNGLEFVDAWSLEHLSAWYWTTRPGGPVTRRASQAVVVASYYV